MAVNLYGYNTQRISGLASGMDTESMVKNMLATDQLKLDKLFQQREKAQWKNDAYSQINLTVNSLRNSYLSILGDKSLTKNSAYNAYKVTMADNAAVKVTGTAAALPTNFKILSTTKATVASKTSADMGTQQTELKGVAGQFLAATATGNIELAQGQTISEDTTIKELADQFGLQEGQSLSFAINGETFTFKQDETLGDMAKAVNDSEKAKASMTVDYSTGAVTFTSKTMGKDTKLQLTNVSATTGTPFAADKGFGVTNSKVEKKSQEIDADSMSFKEIADKAGLKLEGDSFKINGQEFKLVTDTGDEKTAQQVMDEVNTAFSGKLTMSFDENAGSFVLRNDKGSSAPKAAIEVSGALFGEKSVFGKDAGTHTELGGIKRADSIAEAARKMGKSVDDEMKVKVNGKEFTFDTRKTSLSDMLYAISKDKDAKATLSYSEMTDTFQISSANTGSAAKLSFEGLDLFGLKMEDAGGNAVTEFQGTDAKLKVNSGGIEKEIVQASNSFTMDGLTFDITGDKDFGVEGLSVSVERDFQPTIDAIKGFVEDYNKMVGELTTKYYEKTYGNYPPLTEEQRSALTEKEAEKWDEKAKSGVLRNDPLLGNLLSSLRTGLTAKVGETGMSANDLGIATSPWSSESWRTEQGKLVLDESKLLAALKENPNAVQEVFTKISTNDDGTTNTKVENKNGVPTAESGLFVRMNGALSSFYTTMRTKNIADTDKNVKDYTDKMSDLIVKMAQKEERYWAKYSKMETLLTQMQSQQNWLGAQLGLSSSGKQ